MNDSLVTLWTAVRKRLEAAGVESPVLDARLLLEAGAGVSRLDIVTDPRRPVSAAQVEAVDALTRRREAREPVAHIVGRKQFWTLDLAVSKDVLIPRPETEYLVEAALAAMPKDAPLSVLDLGVGSGAILLSLLSERPHARGFGVDASAEALTVARQNADVLGLSDRIVWRQGDWADGLEHGFDVVVSNPPYIVSADIAGLQPEVALFEPHLALDGGADGLEAYRRIIAALPRLLNPGATFAFEVGRGQADAVRALAAEQGLATEEPKLDIAGVPRVVLGRRAA